MSYKAAWDAIDTMNNLAGTALVVRATGGRGGGGTTWSGTDAAGETRTRLNAALLMEDDASAELTPEVGQTEEPTRIPVPLGAAVAIGICVAVTVVFGIIPAPLVDFAHRATLLFLP